MIYILPLLGAIVTGAALLVSTASLSVEQKGLRLYLHKPHHLWDYREIRHMRRDVFWLQALSIFLTVTFLVFIVLFLYVGFFR